MIETAPSGAGRVISWERHGSGPAIIVLHGAGRQASDYRDLAAALEGFTAILVDRNGRGQSLPPQLGLDVQMEDLAAVIHATGARFVFGHSAGGMLALEAARRNLFAAVAVYDPGVSIEGSFARMPLRVPFYAAMQQDDRARALAIIIRYLGGLPDAIPLWLLTLGIGLAARRPGAGDSLKLLPTLVDDIDLTMALDGPASRFAGIVAPLLLLYGEKSPGFLRDAARQLGAVLPEAETAEWPGLGHNGPDLEAPQPVAERLRRFFAAQG